MKKKPVKNKSEKSSDDGAAKPSKLLGLVFPLCLLLQLSAFVMLIAGLAGIGGFSISKAISEFYLIIIIVYVLSVLITEYINSVNRKNMVAHTDSNITALGESVAEKTSSVESKIESYIGEEYGHLKSENERLSKEVEINKKLQNESLDNEIKELRKINAELQEKIISIAGSSNGIDNSEERIQAM